MKVAFYKAKGTLYNKSVRWWDRGIYSHCELIFSNGISASSSFRDGGVRFKWINYDAENWDFVELPDHLEPAAFAWFQKHWGEKYDLIGNFHFIFSPISDDKNRWFCNEAVAAALGIVEPWRFTPNGSASIFKSLSMFVGR